MTNPMMMRKKLTDIPTVSGCLLHNIIICRTYGKALYQFRTYRLLLLINAATIIMINIMIPISKG